MLSRPPPPVLQFEDEEYMRAGVVVPPTLLWDVGMGASASQTDGTRALMARACEAPLQSDEREKLLALLGDSPDKVRQSGISPKNLAALVTHNPQVATAALDRLLDTPQQPQYLTELVTMDMSLHGMEVVNQLTTAKRLPAEFLHVYISNCISSCEGIKDKFLQTRLVRLVCVFLQSLIRHRIINVSELFIEIQAFCIEFSKVREAASLFKILKSLESGQAGAALSGAGAGAGPGLAADPGGKGR